MSFTIAHGGAAVWSATCWDRFGGASSRKSAMYGLLLLAIGAGTAAGQTTTTAPKDSSLDTRIEKRIHHDAMLKKYDISVSVDNHVAKLTGTVPSNAAR